MLKKARRQGFNDKNTHDRTTPCDQDFLRKFVKDVPSPQWQRWFNGPVQKIFQEYGFFALDGIFIRSKMAFGG